MMTLEKALSDCQEMIRVGSKSFSGAAKFFAEEERAAAVFLYGWCRFCDDQIDEAGDEAGLEARLTWLRSETRKAYAGESTENPVFVALGFVAKKYSIPLHYPLELLAGMEMDVRKVRYESLDDLRLYCYRVAGVVGLMMSHIMGISRIGALRCATDLGTAMQLTNIARDVMDDAAMGRCYLPLEWLRAENMRVEDVTDPRFRPAVARIVRRMLEESECYYRSGDAGLKYLSFRSACAVSAARRVYAKIGTEVLRRGEHAWDERVWIPRSGKLVATLRGIATVLLSLPFRFFSRGRRIEINTIWEHA